MERKTYALHITFLEPVLGTQPQKDVATEYTQDKARDAGLDVSDELETLPEMLEKGTTAFHKKDGKPIYYDYMVKGFMKEAGSTFNGAQNVKHLRAKVDNFVFVFPRQIPLTMPDNAKVEYLERPLRAQTAQGPRTSLARSEMLPAGVEFSCELVVLSIVITEKLLRELLDYGAFKGLGQWRNGSYGRFSYTLNAK